MSSFLCIPTDSRKTNTWYFLQSPPHIFCSHNQSGSPSDEYFLLHFRTSELASVTDCWHLLTFNAHSTAKVRSRGSTIHQATYYSCHKLFSVWREFRKREVEWMRKAKKKKIVRQTSSQWIKHTKLHADLLQAWKGTLWKLWVLSTGDLDFWVCSTPLQASQHPTAGFPVAHHRVPRTPLQGSQKCRWIQEFQVPNGALAETYFSVKYVTIETHSIIFTPLSCTAGQVIVPLQVHSTNWEKNPVLSISPYIHHIFTSPNEKALAFFSFCFLLLLFGLFFFFLSAHFTKLKSFPVHFTTCKKFHLTQRIVYFRHLPRTVGLFSDTLRDKMMKHQSIHSVRWTDDCIKASHGFSTADFGGR